MTERTAATLAGRRIVVADDEPHLTRILAFNLGRAGAAVVTARHGAEALSVVRAGAAAGRLPDLLITDYQMPVMNGCDLCRALLADPATAGVPTLMLTARGHHLSAADLASTGVRRLMGKPFGAAELLAHVRELLPPPAAAA